MENLTGISKPRAISVTYPTPPTPSQHSTIFKSFTINEEKGNEPIEIFNKEVISKLDRNPHTSPWVLISESLSDFQKESSLTSDLVYVIQGINGLFINYNSSLGKYTLNPKCDLPSPVKALVYRISELGHLYRHLNTFCAKSENDQYSGLVKQAFTLSIKSFLDEYIRLMAMIDSDLLRDAGAAFSNITGLPHLMVITMDSLRKFMYLFNAVKTCDSLIGGALLSAIYKFSLVGDPILAKCGKTLLTEILRIGKSINFVKIICESDYKSDVIYGMLNIQPLRTIEENPQFINNLSDVVSEIDSTISKHVLKLLFENYKLFVHIDAMYRYLMLAQGDFIRHLMELLKPYLSSSAEHLHLNNMTSILESAINSTNAQFDLNEVLQRLDCKLAQSSSGDLGWDVFTLYYHTRGPLQVVVDYQSVDKYLKVFHFLWFIKRTVHLMDDLSKDQIFCERQYVHIVESRHLFHRISLAKTEMLHFINQLEYFLTFEVLECSKADLLLKLKNASDLDEVIKAHDNFLDDVMALCFLNEESEFILFKLHEIFKKVIQFESLFRSTIAHFSSQFSQHQFEEVITPGAIKFMLEKLDTLCKNFQKLMVDFLQSLMDSSNSQHSFLAFRLDFNEFYLNTMTNEDQKQKMLRKGSILPRYRSSLLF
ncbi:hypothetical protein MXB_5664 [Myxobolus squamalis]|nr:hypothetical protein MXB_5664 [Myxobolus squamalis]